MANTGHVSLQIDQHKGETLRTRRPIAEDTDHSLDAPFAQKIEEPAVEQVKTKWLTIGPYPYEPYETRGDNGSCCGDVPGNCLGIIAFCVIWVYETVNKTRQ